MLFRDNTRQTELIKATFLEFKSTHEILEFHVPKRIYLIFDTLNINWNCDLLLESSDELNDLSIIGKYFSRQTSKYKFKKKEVWTERVIFRGNKFDLNWALGGNRYINFHATEVETVDTEEPWSKNGNGCMIYEARKMIMSH